MRCARQGNSPAAAVAVKSVSGKGQGLVASVDTPEGTPLLVEKPLACLQLTSSFKKGVLACHHCMQPMGSVEQQLRGWIKPMNEWLEGWLERMAGCSLPMIDEPDLTDVVHCRNGCSHFYCSDECEEEEFNRGHRLLCMSNPDLLPRYRQSLVRFHKHAASNQESFALAAKLIAKLCVPVSTPPECSGRQQLAQRVSSLTGDTWSSLVTIPDDVPEDEHGAYRQQLNSVLAKSLRLLRGGLDPALRAAGLECPPDVTPLLTPYGYGKLMGQLMQNSVAVEYQTPLQEYVQLLSQVLAKRIEMQQEHSGVDADIEELAIEQLARLLHKRLKWTLENPDDSDSESSGDEECDEEVEKEEEDEEEGGNGEKDAVTETVAEEDEALHALKAVVERYEQVFSIETDDFKTRRLEVEGFLEQAVGFMDDFEGTALYHTISFANHSCEPSAAVEFVDGSSQCTLMTTREVAAGEEVTISYIENDEPLAERIAGLHEYRFTCTCARCEKERGGTGRSDKGKRQAVAVDRKGKRPRDL